jgi:hypothetical protein
LRNLELVARIFYLGERKYQEDGEKYTTRSFIISTHHETFKYCQGNQMNYRVEHVACTGYADFMKQSAQRERE